MPQPLLDQTLIARPGSRLDITTPALVLDLDALESNLMAMAELAKVQGIGLRPHAKTHKSVAIGKRQMDLGALGLCCAKLSEAEALAEGGLDRFLLTSPVTGSRRIERLLALKARCRELMLVADDPGNLKDLGKAAAAHNQQLDLLIDVDVGQHRTGVANHVQALALAGIIAADPNLKLHGLQGYAGQLQHIADYDERRRASHAALAQLAALRDVLEAAGHPCPIMTGGGTGSHAFDHEAGVLSELQVGSYIVSDVEYDAVDLAGDGRRPFRAGLVVYSRVISANHQGFVTIDAGSKSIATDGPLPEIVFGAPEGTRYSISGDEFGQLDLPPGSAALKVGDLVGLQVPHCDPTINLFDHYHCIRGDALVALWPIEARGASS
ncbi:DSD1 family PLP-dependent enzyme [Pelagibius litoralis]|uniref:DSD1 family PLP-dependent enzyme n=1 Tax=Pelagibius litoralis TaxID=374515 RepID=A0A967F1V7_9PROT|nr:DSD1 family PLP-dependent enzyme [Pelagibius litoralis]NIA71589.1 DSD1 family PLP-dependent enzyme [Pelagibius litoralis]